MKTTLLILVASVLGTAALASNAGRDPLQMQRQKQTYERLQHDRDQMHEMMDQCAKMMRTGHGMMHEHDADKTPQTGGDAS